MDLRGFHELLQENVKGTLSGGSLEWVEGDSNDLPNPLLFCIRLHCLREGQTTLFRADYDSRGIRKWFESSPQTVHGAIRLPRALLPTFRPVGNSASSQHHHFQLTSRRSWSRRSKSPHKLYSIWGLTASSVEIRKWRSLSAYKGFSETNSVMEDKIALIEVPSSLYIGSERRILKKKVIAPHVMTESTETIFHHFAVFSAYRNRRRDHILFVQSRWLRCDKTSERIFDFFLNQQEDHQTLREQNLGFFNHTCCRYNRSGEGFTLFDYSTVE